jgi:hypothetical protein
MVIGPLLGQHLQECHINEGAAGQCLQNNDHSLLWQFGNVQILWREMGNNKLTCTVIASLS